MEKKNVVLLTVIALATLLVAVVGATFAFFTATVKDERTEGDENGKTSITAGSVASTTVVGNVSGDVGKFTASGVYPGHKEIAGLSVTATNGGEQEKSDTKIDIVYNVTNNTFENDEIEVSVYKKDDSEATEIVPDYFGCTHQAIPQESANEVRFNENCTKNLESLENDVQLQKLTSEPVKLQKGTSENLVLTTDTITAEGKGSSKTVYYYVVVEFKETGLSQNDSMNATLDGTINVKAA